MAKELDLSGVDEILAAKPAEQNTENELDLSGVDEVLAPKQSLLDKEIPFTPIFDPTLRDVGETISNTATNVHDFALGGTQGMLANSADELAGGLGVGIESLINGAKGLIPGTDQNKLNKLEEGNLPVDQLPGLTPELIAKLKGQKAAAIKMPEESAADIYKTYQKGSEAEFAKAEERSPILYGAGQIGGSIASGITMGGALGLNAADKGKKILDIASQQGKLKAGIELLKRGGKNALMAAPLMAVEGVTSSKGNLIGGNDAEQAQVLSDVKNNLAFGIPAVIGMQGISDVAAPYVKNKADKAVNYLGNKADEVINDSAFLRQAKKIYKYGRDQGINPASEKEAGKLFHNEIGDARSKVDELLKADEHLGKGISNALEEAEKLGTSIPVDDVVDRSFATLAKEYDKMLEVDANSRGRFIFNKIANKTSRNVSPLEAQDLLKDVDAFIGKFKAVGQKTEADNIILENLFNFRKNLSNRMKEVVPKYGAAAGRFEEFRRLIPETIISGKTPTDISGVYMGSLKNPEFKLFQKMEDMTTGATGSSQGAIPIKQAFEQMKQNMSQFETNDAARRLADPTLKNPLLKSTDEFASSIRESADDAIARRQLMSSEESRSLGSNAITGATGIGQASKSKALYGLNVAGRAVRKATNSSAANISRKIYNMPAESLNNAADQLINTPGLKVLGTALKEGLSSGDQAKKNAALFSIMQNPSARMFFTGDENEEE